MDPWGYPSVSPAELPEDLVPLARRAISSCPALALLIDEKSGR